MRERVAARSSGSAPRACGSRRSTRPACASCVARPSTSASRRASRSTTRADTPRADQADHQGPRRRRARLHRQRDAGKISKLKNELQRRRLVRAQREHQRPEGGHVPRDLPAVHARAAAGERLRLRRPASGRRSTCSAPSRTVAALYQRRFRHILVDEYQDTNHAQYSLIRELTRPVPDPSSRGPRGRQRARSRAPGRRRRHPRRLAHRRRRLRPVDLRLPRRRHPQHRRVRARLPRHRR